MAKISVIGSGSWGTAVAIMLAENGHKVTLWSYLPKRAHSCRNCVKTGRFCPVSSCRTALFVPMI